jgi:hypothetical protein
MHKQTKLQYDAWLLLVVLIICFLICVYHQVAMSMRQNIGLDVLSYFHLQIGHYSRL